jgi:RNA polymerase sigma-70 factor (ECF subfamily)
MAVDERALLDAAQKLEAGALGAIHDRYYPEVYHYALYRTSNTAVAEDIASETFVRLIDALHQGRGPSTTIRGWLFTVAGHLVIDHYRRAPRETAELDEHWAGADSPAQEAEANLDQHKVRQAMQQLTRDQQDVVTLRFGQGYSLEETAETMGKNVNTIKQLQFRAVNALRRLIAPSGGDA